jgi:hypothetical protein
MLLVVIKLIALISVVNFIILSYVSLFINSIDIEFLVFINLLIAFICIYLLHL